MQTRKTIVEIISILYASLLVYTGIHKLMDYELNREQLSVMPLVASFADVFAWLLPLIEFVIAVVIFIPKSRTAGLFFGMILMVAFTGYVIVLMTGPGELPCTCGGFLKSLSWPQHLAFNLVFVILGILAFAWNSGMDKEKRNNNHPITMSNA